MILFVDTETNGLPKSYDAPPSAVDNWPRLVQLGYIAVGNHGGRMEYETIIKPYEFEIPLSVSNLHGITTERARAEGKSLYSELERFWLWVGRASIIVGHNVNFDVKVIGAEFYRWYGASPLDGKTTVDTMKSTAEYVGIRSAWGYKWPKLEELYKFLFSEEMTQTHTALDDIRHTEKCYFELVKRGIL